MDKLLQKYHRVHDNMNVTHGLLVAQALCSRRLMEAATVKESELVLKIMEDIASLLQEISKNASISTND